MRVEIPIEKPENCELRAWCVQHIRMIPKNGKLKSRYDEYARISLKCSRIGCGISDSTLPYSGKSIFDAQYNPPKSIESVRKILCAEEKKKSKI